MTAQYLTQYLKAPEGFGKLPAFQDFVLETSTDASREVLDRWLQEGLYLAQKGLGARWKSNYDAYLYHRFIFRPDGGDESLIGVIRGSMDAVERRFPFLLYHRIPSELLDQQPFLIPMLNDAVFAPLEQTLDGLSCARTGAEVETLLSSVPVPMVWDDRLNQRFDRFLEEVLCETQNGLNNDGSRWIEALMAYLPIPGRHPRTYPFGLEFPLVQTGYARGLELRFWIELLLLLLNWHPASLSLAWPSPASRFRPPTLLVSFREPGGTWLQGIVDPERPLRELWRLDHASQPPTDLRPRGRYAIPDQAPLKRLFSALRPGYPQSCRWQAPAFPSKDVL